MADTRPVRRQARGERRIAEILDAALGLFAEVGYDAATTNAIAARAGISPGSLYQFFRNKEAIAQALSERLVEGTRKAHGAAFADRPVAGLPLDELIDLMLDPLIEFNVSNPGAKTLFGNTDMPAQLAAATRPLHEAVTRRVTAVITARAPHLAPAAAERTATVVVQIVKGMMPPVVAADDDERAALVTELKRVIRGYLAPLEDTPA
ncbi:TetR/AcrR family transcriptional regulator [Polymorphospora rubra]|uniref:TetR family transcriptional regulator n=1 Tax=Polymorphospora rubra TaxID=338584 RepID=A0A810MPD4_9ACTN|nr:TetR/AcrR family transcriptional regulator [Polymorphospora rubra]BCJ63166.1 TetR family transcriptional regulator [Polymorphospora rubra]